MQSNFETEKNQKASIYTAIICGALLLISWVITWPETPPPPPIVEDLIEVNLGNNDEGFGETQPLIKGDMAPAQQPAQQNNVAAAQPDDEPAKDINADDKADEDAAAVTKIEKNNSKKNEAPKETVTKTVKTKNPAPVTTPAPPKPQKPKNVYTGVKGNGNGATEDNGYTSQGNKPGGKGDAGSPDGKPDSYGNSPGGKVAGGALRVSKGDRRIINNYIFMGDLPKATINAIIKVSPEGRGTFITFDKGSTSTDPRYATAIRSYLPNIKFDEKTHESTVTVPFNFKVQ